MGYKKYVYLRMDKYKSLLILKSLAFVTREMYYGKVEKIYWEDYFSKKDFEDIFQDLRITLLYLNELCVEEFKDYESFDIRE